MGLKVLSISPSFPSIADPSRGVFVKERLKAIANLPGIEVRVVSPTPWFPPVKMFSRWYRWSQYPEREVFEGLQVFNPRYFLPPKIGGYFHSTLMDAAMRKSIDSIRADFAFDLIDAHWVFPAGAWATCLGQRYRVPVVMTGRGEDMSRFPDLPLVGSKIRSALRKAEGCIGVSQEISRLMIKHGAADNRTCTIANGIDATKFFQKNQSQCRSACGLPAGCPIMVSVGDRLELKGFHLVVEAMATIKKHFPQALYVIVGGPGRFGRDFTQEIQNKIDLLRLHDNVRMVGPQPHAELINWYNAADLYVMMSSREGSPNVLLEAMACGTPAVGTAVGGIQDELSNPKVGRLIQQRTASDCANAIKAELESPRDRACIAAAMKHRTWQATAQKVHDFFRRVMN